jgi:hypothetical protein
MTRSTSIPHNSFISLITVCHLYICLKFSVYPYVSSCSPPDVPRFPLEALRDSTEVCSNKDADGNNTTLAQVQPSQGSFQNRLLEVQKSPDAYYCQIVNKILCYIDAALHEHFRGHIFQYADIIRSEITPPFLPFLPYGRLRRFLEETCFYMQSEYQSIIWGNKELFTDLPDRNTFRSFMANFTKPRSQKVTTMVKRSASEADMSIITMETDISDRILFKKTEMSRSKSPELSELGTVLDNLVESALPSQSRSSSSKVKPSETPLSKPESNDDDITHVEHHVSLMQPLQSDVESHKTTPNIQFSKGPANGLAEHTSTSHPPPGTTPTFDNSQNVVKLSF